MAKRLQEAEKAIENLQARSSQERSPSHRSFQEPASEIPHEILATSHEESGCSSLGGGNPIMGSPLETFNISETPASGTMNVIGNDQTHAHSTAATHATPKETLPTDLSVDEDGKICYYGPTSAVHDPPAQAMQTPESHVSNRRMSSATLADVRSSLASFGRESATWEEFALGNAALETGIPRQVMARLLHLHWTWVSPMFGWVYRPAFVSKWCLRLLVLCYQG